ncbi:hypothetical protein QTP86_024531 [Hemibagrus guttatus]|nr:hypothetical protein QTP86_024531 [Hemibagrus guttatus]
MPWTLKLTNGLKKKTIISGRKATKELRNLFSQVRKVFNSNEDCRFRHVKRHKHHDMLQSCRGDTLLVKRHPVNTYAHNLPKLSDFVFSKRHKKRTHHRKRRSWHTDPSDPLGSEYPQLSNMRNWRSDPGHGGNVSKETITSVDDPLQVLLSHSAQTPTLEKHRENRKLRF